MNANSVIFFIPNLSVFPKNIGIDDSRFWEIDPENSNANTHKAWLYFTYLNLKDNYDVYLTDQFPKRGIIVLLADEKSRLHLNLNFHRLDKDAIVVIIRADELEFKHLLADVEILQNGKFADGKRSFFIPHWPQPGIIPRDSTRKSKIENIVFKGGFGSLDPIFFSTEWKNFLKEKNLKFLLDTEKNKGNKLEWNDYSTADLVLAVRPQFMDGGNRCDKPATKLFNSWHAGVPALMGKEYAYREVRKSNLDYIEVTNIEEAKNAIELLLQDNALYNDMIKNGTERAKEFSFINITNIWSQILFEKIPEIRTSTAYRSLRNRNRTLKKISNIISMNHSLFEWRKRLGYIYRKKVLTY